MSRRPTKQLTETDLLAKILSSSSVNVVGNYILGKTIGEGSFGKVKLATHCLTGQEVAVKVVDKIHAAVVAREIETWRHLHHPNIAQLYEVLTTESKIYMFTEYCAGGEAFDFLCNVNRLDDQDPATRKMFREIVEAVSYCHDKNFVHRDLKLENVLLTEDLTVKVIDFGFTRPYNERNLLDTYCGSVAYAAPEMITGKKYSGPRADIWSLGVILNRAPKINALDYELPDFLSDDSKSLISQILQINPTDRISVQDILSHPWFTQFPPATPDFYAAPSFSTPEESQLCLEMVSLGLNVESILESVCGDACDASSALWYLLLNRVRERKKLAAAAAAAASASVVVVVGTEEKRDTNSPASTPKLTKASPTSLLRDGSPSRDSTSSRDSASGREDESSCDCTPVQTSSRSISRTGSLKSAGLERQKSAERVLGDVLPAGSLPALHHSHPLGYQPLPPVGGSAVASPVVGRSRSCSNGDMTGDGGGSGVGQVQMQQGQGHRISAANHSGNSLQMLVGTHHQIHGSPLPPVVGVGPAAGPMESGAALFGGEIKQRHLQLGVAVAPAPPQRPKTAPVLGGSLTSSGNGLGNGGVTYGSASGLSLLKVGGGFGGAAVEGASQYTKQMQVEMLLAEARKRRSLNLPMQNGVPSTSTTNSNNGNSTGSIGAPATNLVSSTSQPQSARRTSVGILTAASLSTSAGGAMVGGDSYVTSTGSNNGTVGLSGVGAASNRRVVMQAVRASTAPTIGSGGLDGTVPQIQFPDRMRSGSLGGSVNSIVGSSVANRYGRRSNAGLDVNSGNMVSGLSSGLSSAGSSLSTSPKMVRAHIMEEDEGEGGSVESNAAPAAPTENAPTSRFGTSGGRRKRESQSSGGVGGFVSNLMTSFSGRNSGAGAGNSSVNNSVNENVGSRAGLNVAGVRNKCITEESEEPNE
ncbi:hypothetical protein BCR33DRAFT_855449 [Rhizoclosmatium globosum]|uniref:Protein kinase domain-containing protein n=1 Tax=Rhizoclosmatium globosum TaxID=329046 RepID=A0A1Y2BN64_9FUNG|nr:hypothetical protein BCR33DRAFT_855449 [Rhizoclosmatium globosum]|eukprot:ORY36199.1 hypothetical protein BCR33DRAFT_855449 [Rhizoclosmatium globosum]